MKEPGPAEVAEVEGAEEEALTGEDSVPEVAVEEAGEVEDRMEAAEVAGVAAAEGVVEVEEETSAEASVVTRPL